MSSQENFEAVDAENADEADFSDLTGGKHLEVLGADIAMLRTARRCSYADERFRPTVSKRRCLPGRQNGALSVPLYGVSLVPL